VQQFRVNIKDCVRCGFCNLGCPYGAKRGTLEVQLPAAMARGVELIPNCRIERVFDGGAEGVITAAPDGTTASPHEPGAVKFTAKVVVVAAGTLNSSPLLLRSNLPGLSPACGKYVTLHPALTSFGRMTQPVRGFDGFPKLYYTDQFSEAEHYYLETAFYFPFITAKSLPSFGPELKRFMRSYDHLACTIALVHDEAEPENALRVHGGRTVLDYRLSESSRRALVHSQRSAGRLFFAAGAVEYVSLVSNRFSITSPDQLEGTVTLGDLLPGKVVVSSAHPMGGCRMGRDFATSVTNEYGEVHNHPNLVVADASLFPTSTKVNPYLTIMAFAERAADRIRARLH
jgi:choline dehydrogenase-like flavoprotein